VIENEDEERRGTNIPREIDEGEILNVFASGESPQVIVRVGMDIFGIGYLKVDVDFRMVMLRVVVRNESTLPKYV
jgi:hypothetical protein